MVEANEGFAGCGATVATVSRRVVRESEAVPGPPVVGTGLHLRAHLLELRVGGSAVDATGRAAREVVDGESALTGELLGESLGLGAEPDLAQDEHRAEDRHDEQSDPEEHGSRRASPDQVDAFDDEQHEIETEHHHENGDEGFRPDHRSCFGGVSVQPEEGLEADGEPGLCGDAADSGQHAGHERDTVEGVVADGQGLPRTAEEDLLVGDQPTQPHAVDVDAVDLGSPGAVEPAGGGVGDGPRSGLATGRGDQLGGATRGARRGVGLVGVVQLDDLDGLEEAARPRAAKRIIRMAPMEKFGAMSTPRRGRPPPARSRS